MKVLLVAAVVALIHGSYATLVIKGPTEPVMEGDSVVMECLYEDSELNVSQVHVEMFSKRMERWVKPWDSRFWCVRYYRWYDEEEDSMLYLRVGRDHEGTYRCVSKAENVTEQDRISQLLYLKVHYMSEPSLSREGYTSYLGVPEDLKVRLGDDVVVNCSASSSEEPNYFWNKDGGDWILPSSTLTLRKVSATDGGEYTCVAEHPSMKSLTRKRTISITVLPEDAPWYETSNGRFILMTVAAAVSLLAFIVSMSVFLCRRAKQTKTSKGPIDDRSQKKPIYKASVESLPSTCADKQPLV